MNFKVNNPFLKCVQFESMQIESDLTKLAPIIMLCYIGWYGKR